MNPAERNQLDGEYTYKWNGGDNTATRKIEKEFALVKFSGDISDLPEHFKRNVSVQKAEKFEKGDTLILNDGFVTKFNHDLETFRVRAGDKRSTQELDLIECGIDYIYCPFCGEQIWRGGQNQDRISCSECMTYLDIYGKGEQIVIESGP